MRLVEVVVILTMGVFLSLIGGALVVFFVVAKAIHMATDRLKGE